MMSEISSYPRCPVTASEADDALEFWKSRASFYPVLQRLARRYLTLLSSRCSRQQDLPWIRNVWAWSRAKKTTTCLKKLCQFYFFNNSVKHWPMLIIFGMQHHEETLRKDYSFAHLTLILLLHYLVKCRSRTLAVYNNEFILLAHASAQKIIVRPQNHWKTTVCSSPQPLKRETSMRLVS